MSLLKDVAASATSQFIRLDCEPVAKGRPKFAARSFASGKTYTTAYTPAKTRMAESTIQAELHALDITKYDQGVALKIAVEFVLRRPKTVKAAHPVSRPDLDNYLKLLVDACNGYVWHDDSQVVQCVMAKRYALTNEEPHIEMRVSHAE